MKNREEYLPKLQKLAKERSVFWYIKDYSKLDERPIVEHILNYGQWKDFKDMIKIMGIGNTAKVFRKWAFAKRTNYYPEVVHYFNLYFNKYAKA